ncbi:MAG: SDR family oxidoreductase [Halieaceae bacterium]|jgi:NAD(P)-dependent dehydrogenase (short-subunit alcohol dehydrogenase family)|nr:SDR family oxidoreductase [Halieaceae bacterium]
MSTVLVTGVNRGLGLEFLKQYAEAGWTVIGTCRDLSQAVEASRIADESGSVELYPLEVADVDSVAHLADSLSQRSIDVLILNAGVMGAASLSLESLDPDDFLHSLRVNTVMPALMIQAFREAVKRSERRLIVGMSSILGSIAENTDGGLYSYRASKAGFNAVLRSASHDLRSDGITVLAMHPGWVQTDMGGENALIGTAESIAGMREVIDKATPQMSGSFVSYEGKQLPW